MTWAMELLYTHGPHEGSPMSEAVDVLLSPVRGADCGLPCVGVRDDHDGLLEDMMGGVSSRGYGPLEGL